MARDRTPAGSADREPETGFLDERRRLFAAGSLILGVIVVLALGAIMKTDAPASASVGTAEAGVPIRPPQERPTSQPVPRERSRSAPPPAAAERTPAPIRPPEPALATVPAAPRADTARLADRSAADLARLRRSGGSFTLQLAMVCDPGNARRVLERAGETSRLYLLPLLHNEKSCFRICWGSYRSRAEAERHGDVPAWLRDESTGPRVRSVAELAP